MHQVFHKMKGLIKLHNTSKFLENSSFDFNFRDVAIILDLFWMVFHGICTKTSPVMQLKLMHDICGGF